MSEDASHVFEEKYFNGKSYGRIAQMTGEKPEAVRKTYKRSFKKQIRYFAIIDETAAAVNEVKKEAKCHFKKIAPDKMICPLLPLARHR